MILSLFALFYNFLSEPNLAQAGIFDKQIIFGEDTPEVRDAFVDQSYAEMDIREIIVIYIQIFLGFLGLLFVILIIIAGFKYMTANGDDGVVKESINRIKQATIGLVIILASYGFTVFIADQINRATSGL